MIYYQYRSDGHRCGNHRCNDRDGEYGNVKINDSFFGVWNEHDSYAFFPFYNEAIPPVFELCLFGA
jgi:hypothetical protein